MRLTLAEPKYLKDSIAIISELVNETRIKVSSEGLELIAMDPANVAMVGFKLPRMNFSQLETDEEVLGVNLDDFKRILKRCGSGSSLILEKKENLLEIQIQDRIRRNFTLNLLEIESEEIDTIVYGHTHDSDIKEINNILLFNPGQGYRLSFMQASIGILTVDNEIKGEITVTGKVCLGTLKKDSKLFYKGTLIPIKELLFYGKSVDELKKDEKGAFTIEPGILVMIRSNETLKFQ